MWWGGREGELAEATRHRSRRSRRGTGAGIKTHRLAHKRSERSGRVEPILAAHVEHAEDDFFHREHAANTLARAQRPQRFFPVKNALIFLITSGEQQQKYIEPPILRVDFYDVSEYDSYYERGSRSFLFAQLYLNVILRCRRLLSVPRVALQTSSLSGIIQGKGVDVSGRVWQAYNLRLLDRE